VEKQIEDVARLLSSAAQRRTRLKFCIYMALK